jgi:hypothetical protein
MVTELSATACGSQAAPEGGGSSGSAGRAVPDGRPVHCGRPLSSKFLRGILHRMQRPVMKSNRCPPACKSMTIASLSLRDQHLRLSERLQQIGQSSRLFIAELNSYGC